MCPQSASSNQRKKYQEKLAALEEALEGLSAGGLERDMYDSGTSIIESLEQYKKCEDSSKVPSDQISYKDANHMLGEMIEIINSYRKARDSLNKQCTTEKQVERQENKVEHDASIIQQKCRKLAEYADCVFSRKSKTQLAKKILGGIGLFLGAALLVAGILALVAVTHGGIFGIAIPMVVGAMSVASVTTAATATSATFSIGVHLGGGFLAAIASGGIMTALSGFGFFGGATALHSGMKKTPSHHFKHFTKKSGEAHAELPVNRTFKMSNK